MADAPARDGLEATYKGREVEGFLDLHFYRPFGYQIALAAKRLGLTPAAVTLLGGVLGITAGVFYRHAGLAFNLIGMLLHVFSNSFDNADGQLARLTGRGGREGRALDGLIDNLVFASIYINLSLRCIDAGASSLVWLLTFAAAASHSVQSAAADYLRNAYLYFTGTRSELDASYTIRAHMEQLSRTGERFRKFLLTTYLSYTRQQETLIPGVEKLRRSMDVTDVNLQGLYRTLAKPVLVTAGTLTTNTRMIVLFVCLLASRAYIYLWVEVIILNGILVVILLRQNAITHVISRNSALERPLRD